MMYAADDYQDAAAEFALTREDDFCHAPFGLAEETGELIGKLKKLWRDKGVRKWDDIEPEDHAALVKELGDCCWYISEICTRLDVSLSHVMISNLEKLESRKARGVLGGSGDNR